MNSEREVRDMDSIEAMKILEELMEEAWGNSVEQNSENSEVAEEEEFEEFN